MDFANFKDIIVSSKVNKLEELEVEISTTDTNKVNEFASFLMSETHDAWNSGLAIERFINSDSSIILVTKDVPVGIIEELNTHELMGVAPLETRPVFEQSFGA